MKEVLDEPFLEVVLHILSTVFKVLERYVPVRYVLVCLHNLRRKRVCFQIFVPWFFKNKSSETLSNTQRLIGLVGHLVYPKLIPEYGQSKPTEFHQHMDCLGI